MDYEIFMMTAGVLTVLFSGMSFVLFYKLKIPQIRRNMKAAKSGYAETFRIRERVMRAADERLMLEERKCE